MKSVMQEASSLMKAIEQGWIKAGQPNEFSIKILEEAQKNFIGMTVRSAKIALFFDEKPLQKVEAIPKSRVTPKERKEQRPQLHNLSEIDHIGPKKEPSKSTAPAQQKAIPEKAAPAQQKQEFVKTAQKQAQWNEATHATTQTWLIDTLRILGRPDITFTIEPQHFHLRIVLSAPILNNPEKEKQLLASFATLILETLKRQLRTGLRGHKIVLTHSNSNP
jgi:hypothetical protein